MLKVARWTHLDAATSAARLINAPSRKVTELQRRGELPEQFSLKETLLNIGLAVAILGGSYVIMHFFARAMYVRCNSCGILNARRRVECRACRTPL
jgi:hypothetical protein